MPESPSLSSRPARDLFEERIARVAGAVRESADALETAIRDMPAPIYVTDANGWIIGFNPACIDFAGRTPVAGTDRWCVTWRLYSEDGTPLPHDDCPMAVAINERRPREKTARREESAGP